VSDGVKKIVDLVKAGTKRGKQGRANRTLSLCEPQFTEFQAYCRAHHRSASEVIDALIEEFMAKAAEDDDAPDKAS
jgi:hypothetical protein